MQLRGYIHRDIKPENILLVKDRTNEYKIADFGFAIKENFYSASNIAGTKEYVSPKLLVKFNDPQRVIPGNNFKDDVFSLGRTILEMMLLEVGGKSSGYN